MENTHRQQDASARILYLRIFLAILVVTLLAATAFALHLFMTGEVQAHSNQTMVAQEGHAQLLSPAQLNAAAAHQVAQQYMQALLAGQYNVMWSLLDAQAQAKWPDETSFATFWQAKFQDYRLQQYTLGKSFWHAFWVDPETMKQYDNVQELPVSLQLTLKNPPVDQANVPPEDLDPSSVLKNIPFVVTQTTDVSGKPVWRVLDAGPADIEAPILPPLTPVARSVQVPILMYHHVNTTTPTMNVLDLSLTVTPTMFSQQLDYLKAQGYHSITLNQLMNALYYGAPLPSKPIIFTFDDGYEDNYHFAYTILRQHGYTGMFYIITGKVGWDGQMDWGQLQDMLLHGMQIGSHTIHHVDIGDVLAVSQLEAQQELQISKATLEKNLGIVIQHFCYPNGGPFKTGSQALRQEAVALLAQDGYVSAVTDPGMTGIVQQSQAPFVLLRVRVDGRESLQEFEDSV
jgi:peptidoglycan/xylan/chitin deacetylase (PgdA/CDA1 family)